jgi:hypothetical protein
MAVRAMTALADRLMDCASVQRLSSDRKQRCSQPNVA